MRSYSLFTILLLCVAILLIDIFAFYWLQSITQLLASETLKLTIHGLFWIFTVGLIVSILLLKLRLDDIDPKRKSLLVSSLYGLTVSSFIPKLIFSCVISILYFTNYMFSESASLLIVPLVGLFSGFLPFFIILYGVFRALYRFKVYHIAIKHEDLPVVFDGLKIVQISDLHLGSFNYRYHILERAVHTINGLEPDLIFFTGDLVNNCAWELKGWDRVLKKLTAKRGKYAVLGNHDYGDYQDWPSPQKKEENSKNIEVFFHSINFKLLLNESEVITDANQELAIIGVENWGKTPFKQYGDLKKAMKNIMKVPFKMLLSHDPSHWSEEVVEKTNVSITFSGHTHGMQAALILKNKKWSPIKYKYKHWAGLYTQAKQHLYVNRGLGWLGFPGRVGMRPEITLMELKRLT